MLMVWVASVALGAAVGAVTRGRWRRRQQEAELEPVAGQGEPVELHGWTGEPEAWTGEPEAEAWQGWPEHTGWPEPRERHNRLVREGYDQRRIEALRQQVGLKTLYRSQNDVRAPCFTHDRCFLALKRQSSQMLPPTLRATEV